MKHLQALLALIIAALTRGGNGAARREAQEEILRMARNGVRMTQEMISTNIADFARHFESWFGMPPTPTTPREDPQHAAMARIGHLAVWFLLMLKAVFWIVFGPSYFNVLAWVAVIIALCISIPMSVGLKPLIAGLILKPGLTIQQQERRLHQHVLAGIIAFGIIFGGLFLLRGLVGPLALIGALLVLPILSLCDMVLLYLMGIADAYAHLYGWAAPFVMKHHTLLTYLGQFEHHAAAAQQRLTMNDDTDTPGTTSLAIRPVTPPATGGGAAAAITIITIGIIGATAAHAQQITAPHPTSTMNADSTTSVFPSVAASLTRTVAQAFTIWTEQVDATTVRVAMFERDGWVPRIILDTPRKSVTCASSQGEGTIFRGIEIALDNQARVTCNHSRDAENQRINDALVKALTTAWNAHPLVDPKQGRSCTAFKDVLANAAHSIAGNLVVIIGDTEETCSSGANPVPLHAAGAKVIIILLPSKTDMGPGVSAAARFNAKKAAVEKMAPWITAILAPADVEFYRLPIPQRPIPAAVKIGFWQR